MNPTEETSKNRYIFIEQPSPNVVEKTIVLNPSLNQELPVRAMQVWISAEAIELIKEGEACALGRYGRDKDDNLESKKMWDKHNALVNELMAHVRAYLIP